MGRNHLNLQNKKKLL